MSYRFTLGCQESIWLIQTKWPYIWLLNKPTWKEEVGFLSSRPRHLILGSFVHHCDTRRFSQDHWQTFDVLHVMFMRTWDVFQVSVQRPLCFFRFFHREWRTFTSLKPCLEMYDDLPQVALRIPIRLCTSKAHVNFWAFEVTTDLKGGRNLWWWCQLARHAFKHDFVWPLRPARFYIARIFSMSLASFIGTEGRGQ